MIEKGTINLMCLTHRDTVGVDVRPRKLAWSGLFGVLESLLGKRREFVLMQTNLYSPGRFYFSYSIKVLASYLLPNFECELKDPENRNFTWGENSVRNPRTVLLMRRRAPKEG
jgi:hypothetical protein